MAKKYSFFILLLVVQFASGCHSQEKEAQKAIFPTPFEETIEANKARPAITSTKIPTSTINEYRTVQIDKETPVPSATKPITTQIFPQATIPYQFWYPEFEENIDQIITQSGGRWHIIIKEVDGQTLFTLLPEQRINIASVVKVPLALLLFAALEKNGIPDNQLIEYIQTTGTGGRTFEQLLAAMLVKSEEDATEILAAYIKESVNIPAQLREWELSGIDLEARRHTASGVASLFERLYKGEFVSPTSRELILRYLNTYTPNDNSRIGVIRNRMPETYKIFNKRGSLLTPYVVADSAILENPDGTDYIISIFAFNSEPKTTYELLDQAIGEITIAFWDFISTED